MVQDLDANGDGKVTLGEFTAIIAKHFAAQTVTPEQKAKQATGAGTARVKAKAKAKAKPKPKPKAEAGAQAHQAKAKAKAIKSGKVWAASQTGEAEGEATAEAEAESGREGQGEDNQQQRVQAATTLQRLARRRRLGRSDCDLDLMAILMKSLAKSRFNVPLMILGTADHEEHSRMAEKLGVTLLFEAFADRRYTPQGRLQSRTTEGSVYHDPERILDQANRIIQEGSIVTSDGSTIRIPADTLCVHGDNKESINTVKEFRSFF